ncbi:thioredoxin family protein [Sphingobium sp. UBA5915]|uniref:thioredoxin family protein n=1 Tax=Sphingobium sp. UBA5915 TaxID=1947530 RepID=UPI0039C90B7D
MTDTGASHREYRELGNVAWLRDYDDGKALAAAQRKPMLLLFQEVPGCSTCVHFGQDVLTHPLMVELGSGLVDYSQKMTVAARTMAEKKAVGQRS